MLQTVQRIIPQKTEWEGKEFYYSDIGSEFHGKKSFRLWISPKLIYEDFVPFPCLGQILKVESGFVLNPGDKTVYNIIVHCGFRGTASLEVLTPGAEVFIYHNYRSPLGSLGVDEGAIVVVHLGEPLKVKWHRSGRLYGEPAEGISVIYPDGTVKEYEVPNEEELNTLKTLIV